MIKRTLLLAACLAMQSTLTLAHESIDSIAIDGARPDGHAPIGVMGDHVHKAGEWMVSYRYMFMSMEQNYTGSSRVDDSSFIGAPPSDSPYVVAPTRMTMEMHMAGIMYAPHDHLTLMLMVPYIFKSMDHVRFDGNEFTTQTHGVGDIKLTAMVKLWENANHRVHLNFGLSLPSGSIDEEDGIPDSPMAGSELRDRRLPYPMQLGSGTVDLLPGITYNGQYQWLSWGAQVSGVIRTDENDQGYRLGDEVEGTLWGAWKWNSWWSTSLRLKGTAWGNISGEDEDLLQPLPTPRDAASTVPSANPEARGGSRLDGYLGVNFYIPDGWLKGNRLAVEAGLPLWQNIDGPTLVPEWSLTAGWQLAF